MAAGSWHFVAHSILHVFLLLQVSSHSQEVTDQSILSVVGCREGGQCVCNINSDWTMMRQYRELKDIFVRLNTAENILKKLNFTEIYDRLEDFHDRLQFLENHINNQSVDASITELLVLQRNLYTVGNLVRYANLSSERLAAVPGLQEELQAIINLTNDMWTRNPHSQHDMLTSQLTKVQEEMSQCKEKLRTSAFKGDTLPLQFTFGNWCATHEVEGFGEPVTQQWMASSRTSYQCGAWYKDPLPLTEAQREEIWYRFGYDDSPRYFFKYPTYSDFLLQRGSGAFRSASTDGLGSLMYRGALFYHLRNKIYKYNISTTAVRSKPMIHTSKSYSFNGMTYVAFHADEKGLWVLNSRTNGGELAVSWVDPDTLVLGPTWITSIIKRDIGGALMICGKLYTYKSYSQRLPPDGVHTTQDVFDPETNQGSTLAYDVPSVYGMLGQLTYNPRERQLFGWDNQHLINIDVIWKLKHKEDGK